MTRTPEQNPGGVSRRGFLGSSARNAAGVAAGMVGIAAANASTAGQSQRKTVGVIGVRQQGKMLASKLQQIPGVELVALCDVDERVLTRTHDALAAGQSEHIATTGDARRLIDDPSIDGLVIATPDHSHVPLAIAAMDARKDLYLEQPATHSLGEHDRLTEAAVKSRAIVQTGLPHRSAEHYCSAIELLRSGRLGRILQVKTWAVYRRKSIGQSQATTAPAGVDYAAWLGTAPAREFSPNRFHHNWHWFWDYGSGELGRSGVALLDVALWGIDADRPRRVSATGGKLCFRDEQETPDTMNVQYQFDQHEISWEHRQWSPHGPEGRNAAVAFYGEHGCLIVDRGGWKVYGHSENLSASASSMELPHLTNWVECMRTRQRPTADLQTGLKSVTLCHLGNLALREDRELSFPAKVNG